MEHNQSIRFAIMLIGAFMIMFSIFGLFAIHAVDCKIVKRCKNGMFLFVNINGEIFKVKCSHSDYAYAKEGRRGKVYFRTGDLIRDKMLKFDFG